MRYFKKLLGNLPRGFKVWWAKMFLYMLGTTGTYEFDKQYNLFQEVNMFLVFEGESDPEFSNPIIEKWWNDGRFKSEK